MKSKTADVNILIIDDEDSNILMLTKMLEIHGYNNVVTSTSPLDTIELYKKNKFDLVILDINMPVMSGYDVLLQLQSLPEFLNTQVIASSGDVNKNDINKALDAGFNGYLTKPMRMEDILEVVNKALNKES